MKKVRLDACVFERGLADSLKTAQGLILSGQVVVDDQRVDKLGTLISIESEVRLKGEVMPYVSRGGIKLKAALDSFGLKVTNLICADIGASTGGFTDCLLQHGAKKVYAIDVGRGLLHEKIKKDPRVILKDRTNARELSATVIPEPIDFLVCDVSFISLKLMLDSCAQITHAKSNLVLLVKPQFEAEPNEIEEGGVVRDSEIRKQIIERTRALVGKQFEVMGLIDSPIAGPAGNVEALLWARCRKP
jgi:23S rRNA (cytidine1920-2'-O)/16S rRNA (cytidine1409-2'-O)-methyltransferase